MSIILTKALAIAAVSILMIVMIAPQPAYAQGGLLSGITGILSGLNGAAAALQNFINNVMRPILQSISAASSAVQNILGTLRNFFEQVVWPVAEINRIRGLVQQLIAQFSGALNTLYGINVSSAQLPNPRLLETVMRNRSPADLAGLRTAFVQTYGAVPAAADAHPEERDLMDVDDAMTIDHLMTAQAGRRGRRSDCRGGGSHPKPGTCGRARNRRLQYSGGTHCHA